MSLTAVTTPHAPAPAATYSQGVRSGPFLQVSGQGPVDPDTGLDVGPDDVAAQTIRTLQNVEAILVAGGASLADIIMLRVYLTTRGDVAAMNEAYAAFFRSALPATGSAVLPARTTVMVELPRASMLVEIDALAMVSG